MTPATAEFSAELLRRAYQNAHADDVPLNDAFFDLFGGAVVQAGELPTIDRAYFRARGMAVDGYGGAPEENEGVLSVIVGEFVPEEEPTTLTQSNLDVLLDRALNFVKRSREREFRRGLEESSPAFGLADMIAATWDGVIKVRIILLTNRPLSKRVDGIPGGKEDGKPVVYSVWDVTRLERFESSGQEREDLEVDLREHGGPVDALLAHIEGADYEAYLLVLPAVQLASIYDRWNTRLLEQNVRVFLQARGGVNRGIRETIETQPTMFFAYNNGITATAERVETEEEHGQTRIRRIHNLQIVNGGQTTASIYAASRRTPDQLARVFVQMKLSVVSPEQARQVVPKISQYANSQNRVTAADFFANHPFHLRIKSFSAAVYAPAAEGTIAQTKWFYERARGEYQDARARLDGRQRTRFESEYPSSQIITKTDLGKYLAVWDELPHIVSKGAQSNFAEFARVVDAKWEASPDFFNEAYYRESVAKAIIFKTAEREVSRQKWYESAYRANIVAFGISKLAYEIKRTGCVLDFERVWKRQAVDEAVVEALMVCCRAANDVLNAPPEGVTKNVTQWAKRPAAWERLRDKAVTLPNGLNGSLRSQAAQRAARREAVREQRVLNEIDAQVAVHKAGNSYWKRALNWAKAHQLLSEKQLGILSRASMLGALLTEKQAPIAVEALETLIREGYSERHPREFLEVSNE